MFRKYRHMSQFFIECHRTALTSLTRSFMLMIGRSFCGVISKSEELLYEKVEMSEF
jgi:hypothetical protein